MKTKILLLLFIAIAVGATLMILKAREMSADKENKLGNAYYSGKGVPQSYAKAVYWYKKSAAQGDAIAEDNLGYAYYYGKGEPQSYSKAVYWFKKSAAQGNDVGEKNLSILEK